MPSPGRRVLRHLAGKCVDLKLPAEAIAQIADDVRNGRADPFGVRQGVN